MSYTLPSDSWDTHCHVFNPERYPYVPDAPYAPPTRNIGHLVHASSCHNHVIVMSRPEGTDPTHTLEAIESLNSMGRKGRGTAVLRLEDMTEATLRSLDAGGIRSVRLHASKGDGDIGRLAETIRETAKRIKQVKWMVDLHVDLDTWSKLVPLIKELHKEDQTYFVADHLLCAGTIPVDDPRLASILELVDSGELYVKVSGCQRYAGSAEGGIASQKDLIRRILRAHGGERSLFGSDWPHVRMGPNDTLGDVDVSAQLQLIWECCEGDEKLWEAVMRDNAARLYA